MTDRVAFLGFGSGAQALCSALALAVPARAFDKRTKDAKTREEKLDEFQKFGVDWFESPSEAVHGSDFVVSLVSPEEAIICAHDVVRSVAPDSWYFDMNSVSPKSKKASARELEMAGVKYVDVAVTSAFEENSLSTSLLVSGPQADEATEVLSKLGFKNVKVIGNEIGNAAAIQMVRDIYILGSEAIMAECLFAAHAAGNLDEVIQSFGADWSSQAERTLDRMVGHGARGAEVLTEVCAMMYEIGINPYNSLSTAMRQREVGGIDVLSGAKTLREKLSAIRSKKGI